MNGWLHTEAGIAPGLLHYYFQSKEDLLFEVVSAMDDQLTADWDADTQGIDDPMARINAGMERAVSNSLDHPEFIRLLLDSYSLALDNPTIRPRAQEMLEGFCNRIRREIGALAGIIPGDAPLDNESLDFPGAIAGAINGIAFTSLVRGKSPAAAYNAFKMYILALAAVARLRAQRQLS